MLGGTLSLHGCCTPDRLDDCRPSHSKLNELNWVDLFPQWDAGIAKLVRLFGLEPLSSHREEEIVSETRDEGGDSVDVKVSGLYQSDSYNGYWKYLRFYDDGTVLSVSASGGDPDQIARWFKQENKKEYSFGRYSLVGGQITFSAKSSVGTVDFDGSIRGDMMILKSHSHINGNRGVTEYRFRAFEAIAPH